MIKKSPQGFPWSARIVRPSEYRAIYDAGHKVSSTSFVLFGLKNRLGHHRLGLTVSRRVGSAVRRNRVKRLFREIFRKSSSGIPDQIDFVVNARRGSVDAGYEALCKEFRAAAEKVIRKAATPG